MNRLLCVSIVILLTGCQKAPAPAPPNVAAPARVQEDQFKNALDDLVKATDPDQFRDILHQLNRGLAQTDVQKALILSDADKEYLKATAFLSGREFQEIEPPNFRPTDGYYLEECFLFRDAARHINLAEIKPFDRARASLEWTCRNVLLLGPPGNSWLPAHYLALRGFGSPHDRALVFTALLRQQSMYAAVVDTQPPLVAVAVEKDLFLFDPRLGAVVQGAKGPATWFEVKKQPALLKPHGISPEEFAKAKLLLDVPISALAPRLAVLQQWLQDFDRVQLSLDLRDYIKTFEDLAPGDAKVWNTPIEKGKTPPISPTRSLIFFLPTDKGGVDKQNPPRLAQFKISLKSPHEKSLAILGQMGLLDGRHTHPEIQNRVFDLLMRIQDKFAFEPHEMIERGQSHAALKRLERIQGALDNLDYASLDEAKLRSEVARWRDRGNALYLERDRDGQDPRERELAAAAVEKFWSADQFLVHFMILDAEVPAKAQKTVLSDLLFQALKEPLGQRVSFLGASIWQDKAEQMQNHVEAGPNPERWRKKRDDAWRNARSAWNKHVERYPFAASQMQKRLARFRTGWKQGEMQGADVQSSLRDWSQSVAAQLYLTRANQILGDVAGAETGREQLRQELRALQAKDFQAELDAFLDTLKGGPPGLNALLAPSQLFFAELRPGGTMMKTFVQMAN